VISTHVFRAGDHHEFLHGQETGNSEGDHIVCTGAQRPEGEMPVRIGGSALDQAAHALRLQLEVDAWDRLSVRQVHLALDAAHRIGIVLCKQDYRACQDGENEPHHALHQTTPLSLRF